MASTVGTEEGRGGGSRQGTFRISGSEGIRGGGSHHVKSLALELAWLGFSAWLYHFAKGQFPHLKIGVISHFVNLLFCCEDK